MRPAEAHPFSQQMFTKCLVYTKPFAKSLRVTSIEDRVLQLASSLGITKSANIIITDCGRVL